MATRGAARRERLFERLESGPSVCWIGGPAGSGKTTLISTWLAARRSRACWCQIDSGDADPAAFFQHLGLAAAGLDRRRRALPTLTPEYALGADAFARRFFAALSGRLGRSGVLVLDDCHEVPAEAPVFELLLAGLPYLRPGVRVLLGSRSAPPPPFARLRANGQLGVIDGDDLRLTVAECEEMIRRRNGQLELARLFHERTAGWAAGVVVLLEGWRAGRLPDRDVTPEFFDYFAVEVLRRLDGEARRVLLTTAVLPFLPSELVAELCGSSNAPAILSRLSRDGTFTSRVPGSATAYRYHPLFREFLLASASRELETGALAALEKKAGDLLASGGYLEEAAALRLRTGDAPGVAALVRSHAGPLLAAGRDHLVQSWIDALPQDAVDGDPWLLFWRGSARIASDPVASRVDLEHAFDIFDGRGEPLGTYLAWAGAVTAICLGYESLGIVTVWLRRLEDLIARHGEPPEPAADRVALSACSAMTLAVPDHPDLALWSERAVRAAARAPGEEGALVVLNLVHHAMLCGKLADADRFVLLMSVQQSPFQRVSMTLARIIAEVWRGCEDLAQVQAALELARDTGVHIYDAFILGQAIGARAARGDLAGAEHDLELLDALPLVRPWDRAVRHYLRARVALLRGDLERADGEIRRSMPLTLEVAAPVGTLMTRIAVARIAWRRGDRAEAERQLAAARAEGTRLNADLWDMTIGLLQAELAFADADEPRGLALLGGALAAGARGGVRHILPVYPYSIVAACCERALAAGIEEAQASALVRGCRLVAPPSARLLDTWPWSFKIFALGRFRIEKDGRSLELPKARSAKPLALLKALLALGGGEAPAWKLTEALWPDADGDRAQSSLKTTLHRLRRLLGDERLLLVRDGRLSLNPDLCWVDLWAFEQAASEASRSRERGHRALDLYRGAFLPDDNAPWVLGARATWCARFRRVVASLQAAAAADGDRAAAAEIEREARARDPAATAGRHAD